MTDAPFIAETGALIGDPARANIIAALMDGKARTATELAYAAGVSPQTTSAHLAKLTEGRLITLTRQGRHRYYSLAGREVAEAIEALMRLAANGPPRYRPTGPRDEAMRRARTCYDHLAGRLGVALADALTKRRYLRAVGNDFEATKSGRRFFDDFGIDLDAAHGHRRAFARSCLDWSERRPHIAGALGAALADRCLELRWIARIEDGRAMRITKRGARGLADTLGIEID